MESPFPEGQVTRLLVRGQGATWLLCGAAPSVSGVAGIKTPCWLYVLSGVLGSRTASVRRVRGGGRVCVHRSVATFLVQGQPLMGQQRICTSGEPATLPGDLKGLHFP